MLTRTKSAAGDDEGSDKAKPLQQIVSSDQENIPIVMALAVFTSFSIFAKRFYDENEDERDDTQKLASLHLIFYIIFTTFCFVHTAVSFKGIPKMELVAWAISVLASIGIAVIGIIAAFNLEYEYENLWSCFYQWQQYQDGMRMIRNKKMSQCKIVFNILYNMWWIEKKKPVILQVDYSIQVYHK